MLSRPIASIALCLSSLSALACSPVKSIDIYFERNSSEVSAEQVLRLANWTATLRTRYPNRQSIDLGANAESEETDPDKLAIRRASNVAHILREDLQFTASNVELPSKGRLHPMGTLGGQNIRRVEIDFLPACPHECPCQTNALGMRKEAQ